MVSLRWSQLARKAHYWGAILCVVPILIVTATGILLLLKKEFDWIQPSTAKLSPSNLSPVKLSSAAPQLHFENILSSLRLIPELEVSNWGDVDRLDIRPRKGVVKVRARNHWEVQIDQRSGEVLKVAYRRSDIIEAIHDGSFFHDSAKLGVFLPASVILLVLSITGLYLFVQRISARRRKRKRLQKQPASHGEKVQAANIVLP